MELNDIRVFIKNNSKINSIKIDYTDEGDIYSYILNVKGITYKFKLIEDGDIIKLDYNNKILTDDNDIKLELFEMFDYKNIEYIDSYIIKKRQHSDFDIIDIYDDYYDNNEDLLICNRTFRKNDKLIKIKITCQDNINYNLYYNMDIISGFDNILEKIDSILY